MNNDIVLILTTCSSQVVANQIATTLIAKTYAACVSVIPAVTSYYQYKDAMHVDEEIMLLIKTTSSNYSFVADTITNLNSYEVPEILILPTEDKANTYTDWIRHLLAKR